MPTSLSEDSPFRAGVLPETQVLLAGQDLLTGLSSRAGLEAHFRLAAARARRSGARLAVGMVALDVDPAAPPDEVFGNDLLVVDAAKRLRAVLRETDLLARLGETRFAFVAEEVTPQGAALIAGRLVEALAVGADARPSRGRARVGVAIASSDEPTLHALLRMAEERLAAAPLPVEAPTDAANAESFGARPEGTEGVPATPRWRTIARRAVGWLSLVTLAVLLLSATPAPWRERFALDRAAQQGWAELRARLPWLAAVVDRRP